MLYLGDIGGGGLNIINNNVSFTNFYLKEWYTPSSFQLSNPMHILKHR